MSTLVPDLLAAIGVLCLLSTGGFIFAVWLDVRREDLQARRRADGRADWSHDRRTR